MKRRVDDSGISVAGSSVVKRFNSPSLSPQQHSSRSIISVSNVSYSAQRQVSNNTINQYLLDSSSASSTLNFISTMPALAAVHDKLPSSVPLAPTHSNSLVLQQQKIKSSAAGLISNLALTDQQQQQQQQQQQPVVNQKLKVEDALSYLDQVKFKFSENPHIYNDFLDIMKEFKSQSIDTPGVITRVSTLFKGYPELIVGFNTFLPPGYKIEVQANDNGYSFQVSVSVPSSSASTISTLIPTQTVHYTTTVTSAMPNCGLTTSNSSTTNSSSSSCSSGSSTTAGGQLIHHAISANCSAKTVPSQVNSVTYNTVNSPISNHNLPPAAQVNHISQHHKHAIVPQNSSLPHVMTPLLSPPFSHQFHTHQTVSQALIHVESGLTVQQTQPVEFNHAISYVNKIKSRFQGQPDKYKRFLEILHTYQKEQRTIKENQQQQQSSSNVKTLTEAEVYSQVAKLFENQEDLLAEFGQFLPDATSHHSFNSSNSTKTNEYMYSTTTSRKQILSIKQQPTSSASSSSSSSYNSLAVNPSVSSSSSLSSKYLISSTVTSSTTINTNYIKRSSSFSAIHSTANNNNSSPIQAPLKKRKSPHVKDGAALNEAKNYCALNDLLLFEKIRERIGNNEIYKNFLRCLYIYYCQIISQTELFLLTTPFILAYPELLRWFKEFVCNLEYSFCMGMLIPDTLEDRKIAIPQSSKYSLLDMSSCSSASKYANDDVESADNDDFTNSSSSSSGGKKVSNNTEDNVTITSGNINNAITTATTSSSGAGSTTAAATANSNSIGSSAGSSISSGTSNSTNMLNSSNVSNDSGGKNIVTSSSFKSVFPATVNCTSASSVFSASSTTTTVTTSTVKNNSPTTSVSTSGLAIVTSSLATSTNSGCSGVNKSEKFFSSSDINNAAEIDYSSCRRIGASYCAVPDDFTPQKCSGRTQLCKEVLNDIWVSFPTWSEDSTFVSSRKTQYEEYMYRCEDERFELDVIIESNSATIRALQNAYRNLRRKKLNDDEVYSLDDRLGGTSPTIYRRVIKRIYGDKANDIMEGLKTCPMITIPVVLERLKIKDAEWREARKSFNKIWREQNEKFYLKSLDHQGMNFKQNDMKYIRSKSLLNEIEILYDEQNERARSQFDVNNSDNREPHLVLPYEYKNVLDDAANLLIHHVKRQTGIHKDDKQKIKVIIRQFLPDLFHHKRQELSDDEKDGEEKLSDKQSADGDVEFESSDSIESKREKRKNATGNSKGNSGANKGHSGTSSDCSSSSASNSEEDEEHHRNKKKTASSSRKKQKIASSSSDESEDLEDTSDDECNLRVDHAAPELDEDVKVPLHALSVDPDERYTLFYADTHWYLFFRLHQILCDRLGKIYERAIIMRREESSMPPPSDNRTNSTAVNLRLKSRLDIDVEDYYQALLEMVKNVLDGNLDSTTYEDTLREMFGIHAYVAFTLDKLVSQSVRQLQYLVTDDICQDCYTLFVKQSKKSATGGLCLTAYQRSSKETKYRTKFTSFDLDCCFKIFIYKRNCKIAIEYIEGEGDDNNEEDTGSRKKYNTRENRDRNAANEGSTNNQRDVSADEINSDLTSRRETRITNKQPISKWNCANDIVVTKFNNNANRVDTVIKREPSDIP